MGKPGTVGQTVADSPVETVALQTTPQGKIAAMTGFTPEQVALVQNTVAKGTTVTELAYFLNIAQASGLNPFMREIWCYKDHRGNLIVFAGRDGRLRKAQESPTWNGMASGVVYENDTIEIDFAGGAVNHKSSLKNRGAILGAYAILKPKVCDLATVTWAEFGIYNRALASPKKNTWNTHPDAMIIKVAEAHCLKKSYVISGTQTEYDYEIDAHGIATPIQEAREIPTPEKLALQIIEALGSYTGDDKEAIKAMCIEKRLAGEFTEDFAHNVAQKIGVEL